MTKVVLNSFLIFFFFLSSVFSLKNIQSERNTTSIVKADKAYDKGLKQVLQLENSADALLNYTARYDKILEKPFDVNSDPRYANLTQEQKEVVERIHQNLRENLENQVEKIFNQSEAIRVKAGKIERQLKKSKQLADKANAIQKSFNKTSSKNSSRIQKDSSKLRKERDS